MTSQVNAFIFSRCGVAASGNRMPTTLERLWGHFSPLSTEDGDEAWFFVIRPIRQIPGTKQTNKCRINDCIYLIKR